MCVQVDTASVHLHPRLGSEAGGGHERRLVLVLGRGDQGPHAVLLVCEVRAPQHGEQHVDQQTEQEIVCDRALAVSNTSTERAIADTIVVTHSMGNLMFAGALATGRCSLHSSSTWVGMAGPMIGSMASDFVQETCAGETNAFWEDIGDVTGRCPPSTALKSLAYQGGNFSSKARNAEYAAAQEAYRTNVSALMCGRAYSGLVSKYQAKFWLLGHAIPHKSNENDGMVEFKSCAPGIPASTFGGTYRDRFYATKLNHYDMQFLAGDAILDEAKMPVKWFECLL
jgi:hypothetical protein